MLVNF